VALLLAIGVVWGGRWLLFGSLPGSVADDEVRSARKRAADFQTWSRKEQILVSDTAGIGSLRLFGEEARQKVGWRQTRFGLPGEKTVRAVLARRLPEYLRVVEVRALSAAPAEEGEGVSIVYAVKLKAKDDVYAVSVSGESSPAKLPAPAVPLVGSLVLADDLPPGLAYRPDDRTLLLARGQTADVTWRVNQAAVDEGLWKIFDADPIQFQASAEYEGRLIAEAGGTKPVRLIRSGFDIENGGASEKAVLGAFVGRVAAIEKQVADFRAAKLAAVPGARKDTTPFGGDGSGEPTKTGMRVGGGAVGGAGIGALAGGGEGAGWGALGGAVLGGIYDLVSKSNDEAKLKKAQEADYQRQLAARNAALRRADAETAAYAGGLYADYAKELAEKAEAQRKKLRVGTP